MGMVKDIVPVKMARDLFGGFAVFMGMAMVRCRVGKHFVADLLGLDHGSATMRVPDTPSQCHSLKYRQQNCDETQPSCPKQARILRFHRALGSSL